MHVETCRSSLSKQGNCRANTLPLLWRMYQR